MARKLFISYSHRDSELLEELRVHLRPLERAGVIAPWFDSYLVPGDDFDRKIRKALREADFIGLLVTPRFLASDYCVEVEMDDAIARHNAGRARVIPIIAKPSQWQDTALGKLLATPKDGKPISRWNDPDEAWDQVARDIGRAASDGVSNATPTRSGAMRLAVVQPVHTGGKAEPFQTHVRIKPSDQEMDEFRLAAFETIFGRFEASVGALPDSLSGRVRRLDADRFTATVYRSASKVAGCTIYTGSSRFGSRGIAYHSGDSGETNTMNEQLSVEVGQDGSLGFKLLMGGGFGRAPKGALTADQGAEYLWNNFTSALH